MDYTIEHSNTGLTPNRDGDYGPSDLLLEADAAIASGKTAEWYWVTVWDGDEREAESPCVLYLPETGRIGIAWGSEATWGDAPHGVDEAVDCYLNRPDEWQARN